MDPFEALKIETPWGDGTEAAVMDAPGGMDPFAALEQEDSWSMLPAPEAAPQQGSQDLGIPPAYGNDSLGIPRSFEGQERGPSLLEFPLGGSAEPVAVDEDRFGVWRADDRNAVQKFIDRAQFNLGRWWDGLTDSTEVGADYMRAEPFRKAVEEGKIDGSIDDHWKMGGWSASLNNRVSAAAIGGDMEKLRSAVQEDRSVLGKVGDRLSLDDANLLEKGVKGAAASGVPMVESALVGAAGSSIPFVGGFTGKAAVGTYWQQQGAGQFLRSFLRDKDLDALTPEQLSEYNKISQAMAAPYAAIEFAVSAIPGMKSLGSGVDQQVANFLFRKVAANPTILQRIGRSGTAFAIRWALESLVEEGAQGAVEEGTGEMLDAASKGDTQSILDLVKSLDPEKLKTAFIESGVQSIPAVGVITLAGGGAAGVARRAFRSEVLSPEAGGQGSGVGGQGSDAPAAVDAFGNPVDPTPQNLPTFEINNQEKPNEQSNLEPPAGREDGAQEPGAGNDAGPRGPIEDAPPAGRYEEGREVTFQKQRYVLRNGQFFEKGSDQPVTRTKLIEQIITKGRKVKKPTPRKAMTAEEKRQSAELKEFKAKQQQIADEVLSGDEIAAEILARGIRREKTGGAFQSHSEEWGIIPRRYWAKADDAAAQSLDEWADRFNMTTDDLRAHLERVEMQLEERQQSGQTEADREAAEDERLTWEGFNEYVTDGILPPANLRTEFSEVWKQVLDARGITEADLQAEPDAADVDDVYYLQSLDEQAEAQQNVPPSIFDEPPVAQDFRGLKENVPDFSDANRRDVLAGRIPIRNTRGEGVQYHGTSSKLTGLIGRYGSEQNIYGGGFYTTDAADVSVGYSKKGRGGTPVIYKVTEKENLNILDMNAAVDPQLAKTMNQRIPDNFPKFGEQNLYGNIIETVADLYDAIRDESVSQMISTYEVQETFDELLDAMASAGYDGMMHSGGQITGTEKHKVKIYFEPDLTVAVEEVDPLSFMEKQSVPPAPEEKMAEAQQEVPPSIFDEPPVAQDFQGSEQSVPMSGNAAAEAMADGGGKGEGGLGAAGVPADDPLHSSLPFEMPELVHVAELLGGGKLPRVKEQLRLLKGRAAGAFYGDPLDPRIELKAETFELVPRDVRRALREQANEYAKTVQQQENLDDADTAKVADERYQFLYEQEFEKRKQEDPVWARKTLAHEIGHWIDFLPDYTFSRGNILGHIAALNKYTKSMISERLTTDEPLLDDNDRKRLRKEAQFAAGPRPSKKRPAELKAWNKRVSNGYQSMVSKEAAARGLVTKAQIVAELEPLIAWWNGSETMPDYYKKPAEMYADSFSVFMNNPQALAKRAPKFFQMLHEGLEARPAALKIYNQIQEDIRSGQIHKERVRRLHRAFQDSDQKAFGLYEAGGKTTGRERADSVRFSFDRVFGPVFARMNQAKLKGDERGRVEGAIENYLYRATGHEYYMGRVSQQVMKALHSNDLTWENLSEYMFHQRVMNERFDMANPLGFTPKSSKQRMDELSAELGPQRWSALQAAHEQLWQIRTDTVLEMVKQSGLVTPELLQKMEDNLYYATFAVAKDQSAGAEGSIDEMLARTYGSNVGAKIYRQIGTLNRIQDPAAATVMKDISLMDAARRNVAKTEMVDMMRQHFPNEIKQADMRWNGRFREVVVKEGDRVGTIVVMRDGKSEGWYVPKVFAEAFDRGNSVENTMLIKMLSAPSRGVKNLFTQLNYGFWPVAFVRDVMAFQGKMPRTSRLPFGGPQFWRNFGRAFADSASSVFGKPNVGALESLSKQDWITVANPLAHKDDGTAIDRLMRRYWQNPENLRADQRAIRLVVGAASKWMELGQVFERTVKRAGRLYLDKNFQDMPEWRKQYIIHNYSGSPNFLQKGAANPFVDFVALFYNPWKESVRSTFNRTKESPAAMAWNTAKFSIAPKVAMWAAASGALTMALKAGFGDDGEEWGKDLEAMYSYIPEYDKANYTIIPLGWEDRAQGKVMYIRLPLAEEFRMPGAIAWKIMNKSGNPGQIMAYAGGQLPSGNPVWEVPLAWGQYLSGNNPYDWFRGRPLLNDDLMQAQDGRSVVAMGKYTWNAFGGSIVHRFDVNDYGDDPQKTRMEKFLQLPVISNALGRWVKVSNRGRADFLRQKVVEPLRREQSRSRLNARTAINQQVERGSVDSELLRAIEQDPRAQGYVERNFDARAARKFMRPEDQLIDSARSKEEREALMQYIDASFRR